jgi:hypothetical protein
MGKKRNAYRLLVGKMEVERPLIRTRQKWMCNIKMDLAGIEREVVDWIGMAQDTDKCRALVNSVINL